MAPEEVVFAMGPRPTVCSTGDVCLALDYLEDPVAHGIVQQVIPRSCRALNNFVNNELSRRLVSIGLKRSDSWRGTEFIATTWQAMLLLLWLGTSAYA